MLIQKRNLSILEDNLQTLVLHSNHFSSSLQPDVYLDVDKFPLKIDHYNRYKVSSPTINFAVIFVSYVLDNIVFYFTF